MRIIQKAILLSGVAAVAAAPQMSAAQQADQARTEANANTGIADIVVTARKRTENAQSVPVSMTAFSPQALESKSITTLSELTHATPGLSIQQSGDVTSFNTQLRGQNTLASTLNNDPAVGMYVDGVYTGSSNANGLSLIMDDVAGVEILKGPQGTLYGRNTSAGAIKLDHVIPEYEVSGWARGQMGSHDMHGVAGAVTLPLAKDLAALRVYGRYFAHDGYGRNLTTNTPTMDEKTDNFAATLRLDPAPGLRIVLRGDYAHTQNHGLNVRGVALSPGTNFGGFLGANVFNIHALAIAAENGIPIDLSTVATVGVPSLSPASYAAAKALWDARTNVGFFDSTASLARLSTDEVYNGSGTITYEVNPGLTLKSITGYRHLKRSRLINYSGSDAATDIIVDEPMTWHQWTEEFTASGSVLANRLQYTVGAFYLYSQGLDLNKASTAPALGYYLGAASPIPTSRTTQGGTQTNKSLAFYAQATAKLTDSLSFTGGIRWTRETKTLRSNNGAVFGTWNPVTHQVEIPTQYLITDPTDPSQIGPGGFICEQVHQGLGDDCYGSDTLKFKRANYLASLDYKITPDILTYAKVATGFRSGGGQIYAGPKFPPFKPESVKNFEIGLKSDFFDHRARFNIALYDSKYKNIQRTQLKVIDNVINSVTVNAARATVKGAEAELTVKPLPELTLGFTGAYTDAKYKKGSYFNPLTGTNLSNNKLQGVPKFTYTLSAGYSLPTTWGSVDLNLDYWHTSDVPLQPDAANDEHGTNPWDTQKAYGLFNARLSTTIHDNLTVAIWGKNIFNKKYYTYDLDLTADNSLGYATSWGGTPATWGGEVIFKF
jgi:iron complex outermembrane receptor protein